MAFSKIWRSLKLLLTIVSIIISINSGFIDCLYNFSVECNVVVLWFLFPNCLINIILSFVVSIFSKVFLISASKMAYIFLKFKYFVIDIDKLTLPFYILRFRDNNTDLFRINYSLWNNNILSFILYQILLQTCTIHVLEIHILLVKKSM